jgi:Iodothyronine deiodinase
MSTSKNNSTAKTEEYNYHHFKATDYNFKVFNGPKAGEQYIDFEAHTLDGKKVSLSDYLDKPIVLDTGSITCPMYANTSEPMNALKSKYPDVHFLLLYVREAHPGKRTDGVRSIGEKLFNAKTTCKLYNEKRTILVDSLDGNAHRLYGAMPNMTYVIGTNDIVKFRANWTNIEALKKVLLNIKTNKLEKEDFYVVEKPPLYTALRTLFVGGIRAVYEFITELPQLQRQHKEVDLIKSKK